MLQYNYMHATLRFGSMTTVSLLEYRIDIRIERETFKVFFLPYCLHRTITQKANIN